MKRMIAISSREFSHQYEIILKPEPSLDRYNRERRSSRVPTLDGGAVLIDFGATPADRKISITLPGNLSEADHKLLRSMIDNLSTVVVCTDEAAYEAHPKSIIGDTFLLLLLSDLSEAA